MPLVAVALAVSTLLHAGLLSLTSSLSNVPSTVAGQTAAPDDAAVAPRFFSPTPGAVVRWVAPHVGTALWSASDKKASEVAVAHQWAPLQVVGQAKDGRLPVWDPSVRQRGWVQASDVGPVDPSLVGTPYLPPIGRPVAWSGPARVTMYTCEELGGCGPTASGIWPEPGMVAVDPRIIPLGSTVWIQGLGTFLAADTGSLVKGAHLDVFGLSYADALQWGVQERSILVFAP
jgi:3D (Asp-Asp-Asp) domain-containing protein